MTTKVKKITVLHNEDWSLQVGESSINPSLIEIRTCDELGVEWFGEVSILLTANDARLLGEALIEHALLKGG